MVKSNQVIMDFDKLTIWDSLLLAAAEARYEQPHRIFSERTVFKRHEDEIRHYLDYFGFADPTAFALSAGEKKLLDIVRCLLLKPTFLLLDEPTAGLPDDLTEKVMTVVRELAAAGTSVVIVEHDLNVIWNLCDEVLFMAEGSVILRGDPQSIRSTPDGRGEVPGRGPCLSRPRSAVLEVEGLRSGYHGVTVLKGLDFTRRQRDLHGARRQRRRQDHAAGDAGAPDPADGRDDPVPRRGRLRAARRTRPPAAGSATSPRRRGIFADLTVLENLADRRR